MGLVGDVAIANRRGQLQTADDDYFSANFAKLIASLAISLRAARWREGQRSAFSVARRTFVPPTRAAQLSRFSKRVSCKLARSHVERDAIFKLRYRSYLRAGLISQNSFGRYIEPADHVANAYLMGLYVDRRLVSSLRLQIGTLTTPICSSLELFPYVLEPLLRSNKTVVEMGCVATDGDIARSYVWLPYLILRSWILAADHFHADHIAAAVRPQHQIFYKRTLDCELHSELRQPPHQLATVGLVTLNFATSAERLYENLPFLRSTPSERQQLFEHDRTPSRVTGQHPSVS